MAIVTGAARGIGAAIAKRLATDGLAVGVLDLDVERCASTVEQIVARGGVAAAVAADVDDERAVEAAVGRVVERLGPPTVLVNNAGFGSRAALTEMTTDQWDSVIGVHLRGSFLAARAAARHMLDARWGRIVNVSSRSALGDPEHVNYASAKAGLIGFTRTLAFELGPAGITVNAVAPGFIVSDMTAGSARRLGRSFEEHQRLAAQSVPVGRVGYPEDVAHAAAFFVSPEAGYVSGQVLYVNGGPETASL